MNEDTVVVPGENSPSKKTQDQLELEIQSALKASVEPPKTEAAGIGAAGERLEDADLLRMEDAIASSVDALRIRLEKLSQDPTRTPAARVLQRGEEAQKKVAELVAKLQQMAQAQRKKIQQEETGLESVRLEGIGVFESILAGYAQQIQNGDIRLHELARSPSEKERRAALLLARDFPGLLPESERVDPDEVADMIDSEFSGDILERIEHRLRAVGYLETGAKKLLRQIDAIAPGDLTEKIRGMMA